MKSIVCIPTYNESENIQKIFGLIHAIAPHFHILVIDDGSPDGTGDIVKHLMADNPTIHIIERKQKLGLGTAYCAAFKWAIENGFDFIYQMDADLSHDPKDLLRFQLEIEDADVVLGSRYVSGVNVINWPMSRLLLSWFANLYTRIVTGMPIADATGGFKCFRAEVLKKINLDKIHSNGYAFQIEMTYKAWRKGAHIKEIPIIFTDRTSGESKMSKNIVYEAAFLVWKLKLATIFSLGKY